VETLVLFAVRDFSLCLRYDFYKLFISVLFLNSLTVGDGSDDSYNCNPDARHNGVAASATTLAADSEESATTLSAGQQAESSDDVVVLDSYTLPDDPEHVIEAIHYLDHFDPALTLTKDNNDEAGASTLDSNEDGMRNFKTAEELKITNATEHVNSDLYNSLNTYAKSVIKNYVVDFKVSYSLNQWRVTLDGEDLVKYQLSDQWKQAVALDVTKDQRLCFLNCDNFYLCVGATKNMISYSINVEVCPSHIGQRIENEVQLGIKECEKRGAVCPSAAFSILYRRIRLIVDLVRRGKLKVFDLAAVAKVPQTKWTKITNYNDAFAKDFPPYKYARLNYPQPMVPTSYYAAYMANKLMEQLKGSIGDDNLLKNLGKELKF